MFTANEEVRMVAAWRTLLNQMRCGLHALSTDIDEAPLSGMLDNAEGLLAAAVKELETAIVEMNRGIKQANGQV